MLLLLLLLLAVVSCLDLARPQFCDVLCGSVKRPSVSSANHLLNEIDRLRNCLDFNETVDLCDSEIHDSTEFVHFKVFLKR
jgi:hypothetical protein